MTKRQQMDWCCEHNNEAGGRVGRRITDRWPVLRGSRRKLAIGRSAKFSHSADAAPSINGHGYTGSADAGYGAVCSATIRMEAVLPHLGMLPSGSSIASPGCSRRHVSLSIDYTGSAAPHGVTQTGFPVRSTSLLSRPDLAPPKSRRAAEGIGRSGATRSHAQRAVAREHGEDGEHRTFPEVSTVAHSRRSRIGRLRIHCEA